MNEKYLEQFRRTPDSKLVETIHARLERRERIQTVKRYSVISMLTLIFLFGVLMTFSSTVRAEVLQTIEEIAGLRFDVTNDYPGDPDEKVNIVPSEYLSLEEAQSRFPAPIMLPTYVPQGYELLADVALTDWGEGVLTTLKITWEKRERNKLFGRIDLDFEPCSSSSSCGMIVGEGALEEITLNGEPAAVIRGSWNYDTKEYDLSELTAIQWRYDENTVYRLSSYSLSLEELIRIAESIP